MKRIAVLLTLVLLAGLGWGYYHEVWLPSQTVPVVEPIQPPEPPLRPNQETAPRNEPTITVVPQAPRQSGPIRYDRVPERPWGYSDYCERYPTRPECGGPR